jgi:hypothetical protein
MQLTEAEFRKTRKKSKKRKNQIRGYSGWRLSSGDGRGSCGIMNTRLKTTQNKNRAALTERSTNEMDYRLADSRAG